MIIVISGIAIATTIITFNNSARKSSVIIIIKLCVLYFKSNFMCMYKILCMVNPPIVSSKCSTTVITVLTTICSNLHYGYLEIVVTYRQLYLSTDIKAIYYVYSALRFLIQSCWSL